MKNCWLKRMNHFYKVHDFKTPLFLSWFLNRFWNHSCCSINILLSFWDSSTVSIHFKQIWLQKKSGYPMLLLQMFWEFTKGRLQKKVINFGHRPNFGYPLPPPLNLGHPKVKICWLFWWIEADWSIELNFDVRTLKEVGTPNSGCWTPSPPVGTMS